MYQEIKWDFLQKRRNDHKLCFFFKMKHNLTPTYLSALVPQNVGDTTRYSLRNSNDLQTVHSRTTLYSNSFLPSTVSVRDWNNLSPEGRQIDTLNAFKQFLNRGRERVPKYYYGGNRSGQLLHIRLRTNCSGLSNDLFLKNISESPLCQCGRIENAYHYFFECSLYARHRIALFTSLSQRYNVTLNLLLFADASQSDEANLVIFEEMQKYIIDTKQFG